MSVSEEEHLPGELLCIGNALLDITYYVDPSILIDRDLKPNQVTTLSNENFASFHEELDHKHTASGQLPGGSSQNVARAVQWLLPASPGIVNYLGAICCDRIGTILQEKAAESHINGKYEIVDDATGCCIVLITGEHNEYRTLLANIGGASKYSMSHLEANWAMVEQAKVVFVEGFFLPTNLDAVMKIGKYISESDDKKLILSLGAPYIPIEHKDKFEAVLPYVDILIGNRDEFESVAKNIGVRGSMTTIAVAAAKMPKANQKKERVVILTQSEQPVIVALNGGREVKAFQIPPLDSDRFVDRNGSSDAFVGGYIAQLLRDRTLEECIRCGFTASAISIQHLGCSFPKEKPINLDKLSSKDM